MRCSPATHRRRHRYFHRVLGHPAILRSTCKQRITAGREFPLDDIGSLSLFPQLRSRVSRDEAFQIPAIPNQWLKTDLFAQSKPLTVVGLSFSQASEKIVDTARALPAHDGRRRMHVSVSWIGLCFPLTKLLFHLVVVVSQMSLRLPCHSLVAIAPWQSCSIHIRTAMTTTRSLDKRSLTKLMG